MQSIAAIKAQCPGENAPQHRVPQARSRACALPRGMLARWAWQPTALSKKLGQRAKDRHQLGWGLQTTPVTAVTEVKMSQGSRAQTLPHKRESCSGHMEKGSGL